MNKLLARFSDTFIVYLITKISFREAEHQQQFVKCCWEGRHDQFIVMLATDILAATTQIFNSRKLLVR